MADDDDWLVLSRQGLDIQKSNPDDETTGEKIKNFFGVLGDRVGDYEEGEETYVTELRKKYEEFSYQFGIDPVHVAVYAVNIVCDVTDMLFKVFGLMFENMRPSPRSYTEDYSYDYSYDDSGYEDGKSKEKEKSKRREKIKDMPKDKGVEKSSVKDDPERTARDAEKSARQARAASITESSRAVERYNARVKQRAASREMSGVEMLNDRAMSRN